MKGKIAVAIAGPIRYVVSTVVSMQKKDIEGKFDYFIHLWNEDTGNKKRDLTESSSVEMLHAMETVKYVIYAKPYIDKNFVEKIDITAEEGQSNIASILGMFISMDVLMKIINTMPENYGYCLRMRTDCLFMESDFFISYPASNEVQVSKNFLIPHAWVSDHLMFAKMDVMVKIWCWSTTDELYKAYVKADANPEKLLSKKIKKLKITIFERWIRYRDYQIIYNPPKNNDPKWVQSALLNESVQNIYLNFNSMRADYLDDVEDIIYAQKENQDYYSKPLIKKVFIKIKKWMVSYQDNN
jgi:hypothetical protein